MCKRYISFLLIVLGLGLAVAATSARALELPVKTAPHGPTTIDQAGIRGLLAAYLKAKADSLPAARIEFKSIEKMRPLVLPPGSATCEVMPTDPAIIGSRGFTLIFRVDGRVVENLALHAELQALAPVVVASIDLPRGVKLAPGDVRLVERDLSDIREPYLSVQAVLGKGLRRSLRAGEVLEKGLLVTPPLVHRGDLVTMTVHEGALILTARGAARDNGTLGETIRVSNTSSQKVVMCRVSGPGEVQVEM